MVYKWIHPSKYILGSLDQKKYLVAPRIDLSEPSFIGPNFTADKAETESRRELKQTNLGAVVRN